MADRVRDKVAIVFGAGQTPGETIGNGRATAVLLASEGAKVLVVDRDEKSAVDTVEMIRAKGGEAQAFVADVVSEGIVDFLELVEVQIQHDVANFAIGARGLQCRVDTMFEFAAIDQAGEGVVGRLVGERALQPALLADVMEDHDDADQPAGPIPKTMVFSSIASTYCFWPSVFGRIVRPRLDTMFIVRTSAGRSFVWARNILIECSTASRLSG